jgi:methionyl-tRNA formyltransferase
MTKPCRFIVLGTGGVFTYHVLRSLIGHQFLPLAYLQYGASPQCSSIAEIEIEQPETALVQMLEDHAIPVYYTSERRLVPLVEEQLADYLLVACWPALLPAEVISSVSIAALNLHPSLLPAYRGIDPVGDQLLTSDPCFGVTLHLLNARLDEGDIVLQQALGAPGQTDKTGIEAIAAAVGAGLFIQAVQSQVDPGWVLTSQQETMA